MITLVSPRLVLSPPAESHAQALAEIHQDPEVAQYLLGGIPATVSSDAAWRNVAMLVGHWHLRRVGSWVVEERATRAVIGRVGFWCPPSWPAVELTSLIRRSHWGQGFATEAARRSLQWAQEHTRLIRVSSLIQPDNKRSIRVAVKLGETLRAQRELEGILHHEYHVELKR